MLRAEHKRLEDVAEAEWREMKTALANLSERTSATDESTSQIHDLCSDAQLCSVQWEHERMRVNACAMQVRELAAASGLDSNGRGGIGNGGKWKECRTSSINRARGGRKVGGSARRTSNAGLEGSMQVLPNEQDKPSVGGEARDTRMSKMQHLQEMRREHESRLDELREERRSAEAAVEQSAKFVANVLALEREERQVAFPSCLPADDQKALLTLLRRGMYAARARRAAANVGDVDVAGGTCNHGGTFRKSVRGRLELRAVSLGWAGREAPHVGARFVALVLRGRARDMAVLL